MAPPEPFQFPIISPELVDHLEGNKRWLNRYRRAIVNDNRAQLGLEPLPQPTLMDRILGRDGPLAELLASGRSW